MQRPHQKLRRMMAASDIDAEYLARKLLLSKWSLSKRMMGRYPWRIDECYQIMDLLAIPYDQMHLYFPKGGIAP